MITFAYFINSDLLLTLLISLRINAGLHEKIGRGGLGGGLTVFSVRIRTVPHKSLSFSQFMFFNNDVELISVSSRVAFNKLLYIQGVFLTNFCIFKVELRVFFAKTVYLRVCFRPKQNATVCRSDLLGNLGLLA